MSLKLVDPRYYLNTALAVLGDDDIAGLPDAFSPWIRAVLERMLPDAVLSGAHDAATLGPSAVSDGRHVILASAATDLAAGLRARGYVPVGIDLCELREAGGGAKRCTLELRA